METNMDTSTPFSLRSGLTIYPSQDKAMDQLLDELARQCPTQFALLVDQSGQMITVHGDRGRANLTGLSSLVAADMAASQEIARMTGQYQNCQLVMREGQESHFFITEAGKHLVLFVQISRDVPLGWARMLILQTARKLIQVISKPPADAEKMNLSLGAEADLEDLFGDALDEIWTGK